MAGDDGGATSLSSSPNLFFPGIVVLSSIDNRLPRQMCRWRGAREKIAEFAFDLAIMQHSYTSKHALNHKDNGKHQGGVV